MHKKFPISLVGLVVTAVVFVLQAIPITGICLMFTFAMAWSAVLINASMIAAATEVFVGRVSRVWLCCRWSSTAATEPLRRWIISLCTRSPSATRPAMQWS
jgi:hypothetical protein